MKNLLMIKSELLKEFTSSDETKKKKLREALKDAS